jgi:translation initiation factor 2A
VDNLPAGAAPANGPAPGAAEGDENLSKAALKNKKKREAKKAKDAEAKAAGLTPTPDGPAAASGENRSPERRDRREHQRSRSKGQQDIRTPSQGRYRSNTHQGKQNGPHNGPNGTVPTGQMNNLSINPTATRPQDPPELSVTSPGGGSPNAKKLRGLQKKIRAIEDLEMRLAGGEKLEDTQMKKIGTKAAVQAELGSLEAET